MIIERRNQFLTGKTILRILAEMMDKSTSLTYMTLQDQSDIRFSYLLRYGYTYYEMFNFQHTLFEIPQYFRTLKDLNFPNKYFSEFGFEDAGQIVSVNDFVVALEFKNSRPINEHDFRKIMRCINANAESDLFYFTSLPKMQYKPRTGRDLYALKYKGEY